MILCKVSDKIEIVKAFDICSGRTFDALHFNRSKLKEKRNETFAVMEQAGAESKAETSVFPCR